MLEVISQYMVVRSLQIKPTTQPGASGRGLFPVLSWVDEDNIEFQRFLIAQNNITALTFHPNIVP